MFGRQHAINKNNLMNINKSDNNNMLIDYSDNTGSIDLILKFIPQ